VVLEVHADDLVAAGTALRRIGDGVSSYGHQLDHRVAAVAIGVEDEVGSSLTRAWDDVARAIDDLAAGFETYGRALEDIAARYAEIDARLAAEVDEEPQSHPGEDRRAHLHGQLAARPPP
jgi:hypothetical protein